MATYSEMDEYSQYARVADGSVFITFAVAVAGKYFVILPLGFGRETREKQWAIYIRVYYKYGFLLGYL
jgi:hypothetical protein